MTTLEQSNPFDGVFETGRDRGADSAAPAPEVKATEPEPQPEPAIEPAKAGAEVPLADAEEVPVQGRDSKTGRFVPVSELVNERKKFQSRFEEEARLRTEAEDRLRRYEADMAANRQRMAAQQNQQQRQAPSFDEDPVGALEHQGQMLQHQSLQMQEQFLHRMAHYSERIARKDHGDEAVNQATEWALQTGVNRALFERSQDPYGDLMKVYQRHKTVQDVGDDPAGYRKRIEDEVRLKVIEEFKTKGLPEQQVTQRFPGSLATATAAGSQHPTLDPRAFMADAFSNR